MGYCSWCPYLNKWYTFAASIFVALCCGLTYTFAIWSGTLKAKYDLTQEQLQLIASAANLGGYFSIFSGFIYDALERHKKVGPRLVLLVGCVANAAGYVGLWAAVQGLFQARLWHLAGLAALAANGGTWGDTATLVTNVRNFPSSRGSVVGVLKAAVGLSGSLFAMVYTGAFAPDKHSFLLFLALAPAVVGLAAAPFINHCSFVQQSELQAGQHVFTAEGRFIFSLQALGTLAVYLIATAAVSSLHALSRATRLLVMAGALALLLPLLLIPLGSGGILSRKAEVNYEHLANYEDEEGEEEWDEAEQAMEGAARQRRSAAAGPAGDNSAKLPDLADVREPLLRPEQGAAMQRHGAGQPSAGPGALEAAGGRGALEPPAPAGGAAAALPPSLSPWQCLRSSTFWLLFAVLVIGMGSGLTLLNNLAQVVKALQGEGAEATPVLVSLFSVGNCAGRMAFGYVPERLLHACGTPRLLFLPLVSALMAATCAGLAYARLPTLFPLAAAAGFAFGGHWSLFPALVSELFGLARFAANYTLAQLAPAAGSFGLALGLAGRMYERALARHGGGGTTCVGQDCFRDTFLVEAVLGLVATAAAAVLCRRHSGLYEHHARQLHTYDEEVLREGSPLPARRV